MINLSQAIDIINNRRNNAELKVFYTLNTLRNDKIFSDAENKINELNFEIARRETLNIDLGTLREQLAQNEEQLNSRLVYLGFSKKDIEIKYVCKKCKDTGFIKGKQCSCLRNLMIHNYEDSSARKETDIDSFSKINFDVYDESCKNGYINTFKQLKKYTENFPKVIPFLLLIGDTGTGKSYMSSVISNVLTKKGFTVLYLNACELNDIFLKYHLADIEKKQAVFSPLIECDLLVIDDLGSENIYKNVTVTYLYTLITKRNKKNTIITTNLDNNQISQRYEKRVSSRLIDINYTRNVPIKGNDLRLKNRK